MKFFPKTRARIRSAYEAVKEVVTEILNDIFYPVAAALIVGLCVLCYLLYTGK